MRTGKKLVAASRRSITKGQAVIRTLWEEDSKGD